MAIDVFISFSSSDKALTERIYDRLQKYGITPWMSSKDIAPGGDYQQSIVDAIQQASVVLLIFSSHANRSREIVKELSLASTKTVIPVRIEDVMPEGAFLYQISNRQFYDLLEDFDRRLDELCVLTRDTVEKSRGNEAVSTSTPHPPRIRNSEKHASRGKGVYLGIGVAAALLIIGGVLFWSLRSKTPELAAAPNVATAPSEAPPRAVLPTTETSRSVAATPVVASSPTTPQKQGNTPAVSLEPSSTTAPGTPDAETAAFVSLLAGQNGFRRLESIRSISARIPATLTAADAAAILERTESSRNDAIKAILPHMAPNLSGSDAARVIGDQTGFPRSSAITLLVGSLRGDLSAPEVVQLLKDTDNSRVDALRSIVDHIRPLDAAGAKDILGPLRGFPRLTALRAISMKLPIDLSGTQAAELLEGTESSRTDAIKSLASHLGPQDAAGINSVLGDLRDFPRLTALRSLADTGRIEHGLSQDDIQQIISGIGSQRSDAL